MTENKTLLSVASILHHFFVIPALKISTSLRCHKFSCTNFIVPVHHEDYVMVSRWRVTFSYIISSNKVFLAAFTRKFNKKSYTISIRPLIHSSGEHLNPKMTSSFHLWLQSSVDWSMAQASRVHGFKPSLMP